MMRTDDLTVYLARHGDNAVGTTAVLVMPHITYTWRPTAFMESMYVRDEIVAAALRRSWSSASLAMRRCRLP